MKAGNCIFHKKLASFLHQVSTLEVAHHHMHCICSPPWAWLSCTSIGIAFVCLHGHFAHCHGQKACTDFTLKKIWNGTKKRSNIAYKLIICLNYKGKKCERNKGRSKIALICPIIKWRSCELNKKRTSKKKKTRTKPQKKGKKREKQMGFVKGRKEWMNC